MVHCPRVLANTDVQQKLIPQLHKHFEVCLTVSPLEIHVTAPVNITKLHRVISLGQKAWMSQYFEFNKHKRKQAKHEFDKAFSKFMKQRVREDLREPREPNLAESNH